MIIFTKVDDKLVRGRPWSFDDQNICVECCTWNMDSEVHRQDVDLGFWGKTLWTGTYKSVDSGRL